MNGPRALQVDPFTLERQPQAMVLRPPLLHQLAIAAAVKMQLALEASMAERRARETALMPAGGFGHVVTNPVLGDQDDIAESSPAADIIAESSPVAAANMGPVAQVTVTAIHLCFGFCIRRASSLHGGCYVLQ